MGTAPRAGIGWGGQTRSTRVGPGEERPPSPAREHLGLPWSASLRLGQSCPLSHHFRDSQVSSQSIAASSSSFPRRSHPGGRRDWAPRPNPEGHVERQPRRPARGGAARGRRTSANGPRGRGRRGCTRLCTCGCGAEGRGGAGLGLALLGLACSGLLFGGLCPGPGTGTWVPRQLSSHAPPRLAESRLVPGPAAQAGVKFPLIWGLGAGVAAGQALET